MGAGESKLGAPREEDIQMKMMEIYALRTRGWKAAAEAANNIGAYVRTYRRGLGDAVQRLDSGTKASLRSDAITELTAEASTMRNTLRGIDSQNKTPRNTLNRKLAAFYDAIG